MAVIPDVGARQVGRSNRAVVSDRSGEIAAGAVADIGETATRIGTARVEREDRLAYARAKSALLQADITARSELETDNDYATHEKRYGERVSKAVSTAALKLSPRDRALFEEEAKLDVLRGTTAVRTVARGMETDAAMADLGTTLEANRAAALQAKDPETRSQVIKASMEAISATRERYGERFSEVDATKMRQQWTQDYAEASVSMLPAGDRVAMLKKPEGTAASFLQPDVRAKLLKDAEKEGKEEVIRAGSQTESDAIMQKHNDRGEALAAARKIKDPELRDATTQRVNSRFAEIATIDAERNEQAFDDASTLVEQAGSIDRIDPKTWQTVLTQPQRQSLEQRAKQIQDGVEPSTDLGLWYELRREATQDPEAFVKRNLMTERHLLSEGDFQGLADLQASIEVAASKPDGKEAALLNGVRNANQIVEATLLEHGMNPNPKPRTPEAKSVALFARKVDERVVALQSVTGKKVTTEEVQGIVDELAVKGEVPGRTGGFLGFFSSPAEKHLFEIEDGETFAVTAVDQVPARDRREIEMELKKRGRAVTTQAILTLYNAGLGL